MPDTSGEKDHRIRYCMRDCQICSCFFHHFLIRVSLWESSGKHGAWPYASASRSRGKWNCYPVVLDFPMVARTNTSNPVEFWIVLPRMTGTSENSGISHPNQEKRGRAISRRIVYFAIGYPGIPMIGFHSISPRIVGFAGIIAIQFTIMVPTSSITAVV